MFLPYLFTYTEIHTFTVIVSLSLSAETDKRCRYELWQGAYSFIYFASLAVLTLSPPIPLSPECQSARMSKIKNGGLDQYGAESFEQQQFGTAGVEGVNFEIIV